MDNIKLSLVLNKENDKAQSLFKNIRKSIETGLLGRIGRNLVEPLQWLSNPQPAMAGVLGGEQKRFLFEKYKLKNGMELGISLEHLGDDTIQITIKFIQENQFIEPEQAFKELTFEEIAFIEDDKIKIEWEKDQGKIISHESMDLCLTYSFKEQHYAIGIPIKTANYGEK